MHRAPLALMALCSISIATPVSADSEVQIARPCSRPDLTHAVARSHFLAISEPGANRVALYDISGDAMKLLTTVGMKGENASQFNQPSGVAIDAFRRLLYVSDAGNHRIQMFRLPDDGAPPTLTFAKSFGQRGNQPGQLESPGALTVDDNGNIYVIDGGNVRVQVFSAELQPQRVLGGDGALQSPLGIAATPAGDRVYVADAGLRRVQVFALDGSSSSLGQGRVGHDASGSDGKFFYPADVALSNDGTVLVADCGDHIVQRFDAQGRVVWPWGHFGPGDGGLNQPRAITVDGRDRVFILDFSGRRAQVFSTAGVFARSFRLVNETHGHSPTPPL